MKKLHIRLTTTISKPLSWMELSPDGHWLAVGSGTEWQVINTKGGDIVWTFLLDSRWIVLSLDGKQVASQLESNVLILLNNKGQTQSKRFDSAILEFIFTPTGNHLWIALYTEQKTTTLALLDTNTLAIEDLIEIPFRPEDIGEYDLEAYEVSMTIHSPSGLVAVTRTAGDTYFDTRFFRTTPTQITALPRTLPECHGDNLRPLHFACFSASGEWFAALDGSCLKIWQLPEMNCMGQIGFPDEEVINTFAFLEDNLLVAIGGIGEIRELQLLKSERGRWSIIDQTALASPLLIPPYGMVRFLASGGITLIGIDNRQICVFDVALH
jgi:WD40 repeat protein